MLLHYRLQQQKSCEIHHQPLQQTHFNNIYFPICPSVLNPLGNPLAPATNSTSTLPRRTALRRLGISSPHSRSFQLEAAQSARRRAAEASDPCAARKVVHGHGHDYFYAHVHIPCICHRGCPSAKAPAHAPLLLDTVVEKCFHRNWTLLFGQRLDMRRTQL